MHGDSGVGGKKPALWIENLRIPSFQDVVKEEHFQTEQKTMGEWKEETENNRMAKGGRPSVRNVAERKISHHRGRLFIAAPIEPSVTQKAHLNLYQAF